MRSIVASLTDAEHPIANHDVRIFHAIDGLHRSTGPTGVFVSATTRPRTSVARNFRSVPSSYSIRNGTWYTSPFPSPVDPQPTAKPANVPADRCRHSGRRKPVTSAVAYGRGSTRASELSAAICRRSTNVADDSLSGLVRFGCGACLVGHSRSSDMPRTLGAQRCALLTWSLSWRDRGDAPVPPLTRSKARLAHTGTPTSSFSVPVPA